MKRFLVRMGRFFWSRSFLKFVLWTVTLIVLFYAEEDWRGAHAWAATKAKWEARGETLDYAKFIPPPIPDDQNLAAISLFRLERVGHGTDSYLDSIVLRKAMESGWAEEGDYFTSPRRLNWLYGELPDVAQIRASVSAAYTRKFAHAPPADALAQLEALDPYLVEIRGASMHRPLCRFPYDDTQAMPAARGLSLVTASIGLSRLLTDHAILALDAHRPDRALADFEAESKLGMASGHDPSLVGGLVQIGVSSISLGILYDGLAYHDWDDAQLAEFERELSATDFLATYRFCMSAEAAVSAANLEWIKHHPRDLRLMLGSYLDGSSGQPTNRIAVLMSEAYYFLNEHLPSAYWLWPRGWFDLNKAGVVNPILEERDTIEAQGRRVDPGLEKKLDSKIDRIRNSIASYLPWNVLWTDSVGPIGNQPVKFAYAQARVDEARIVCALERYWLAHRQYPASLDLLAPTYLTEIPRDVMTDKPYHYEARPDGTFRLYSVGWNLTDEGGVQAFINDPSHSPPQDLDLEQGDWVWPVLKTELSR